MINRRCDFFVRTEKRKERKIRKGVVAERFAEKPLSTRIEKAVGTRPRGIRSGVLIGRLKGKRDLLSSSSFPERFSLLESMLLPAFNTVEKIFSVSDEHFRHNDFFPLNSSQSFSPPSSFVRELTATSEWKRNGGEGGVNVDHQRCRRGVIEELVFGWETESPVGRVFDAAFRGESSPRWQCVGNCCSRNAAPKKNRSWPDALLFFSSSFFLPSPSYNLHSYAIVHRDGHRTLPTRQWAIPPRVCYRRAPEKNKGKMYVLRFRCNFFRFLRGIKRGTGGSTRLDNDTNGKDGRRSTFHRVLFDPPRPCVPFYEIESKKKGKMSPMTARLGVTKPPKNSA